MVDKKILLNTSDIIKLKSINTKKLLSCKIYSNLTDLTLTTMLFALTFCTIIILSRSIYHITSFFLCIAMIYITIDNIKRFCLYLSTLPTIVDKKNPLHDDKTLQKFLSAAWQFCIHLTMSIVSTFIIYNTNWISKPWTTYSEPQTYEYVPLNSHVFFYILQLSIWIYTGFSHRFNKKSHEHKDYTCMYIHHVITIGLLLLSFFTNQLRIGIAVLFLHDFSDIFIDFVKLLNYLEIHGKKFLYITETLYCAQIVVWIYTRLVLLPYIVYNGVYRIYSSNNKWVIDNVNTYGYILLKKFGKYSYEYRQNLYSFGCISILITLLLVLHVWWTCLLLRIATRIVTLPAREVSEVYDEKYNIKDVEHMHKD